MTKERLLAFTDSVISIILTIMVLELKVPSGTDWADIAPLLSTFESYVISFVFIGIYWNNHHHMMHAVHRVNGRILWANLFLLFWISLIPFTTAWIGQTNFSPVGVAIYGVVLLMAGVGYYILEKQLLAHHASDSMLSKATGARIKEKISIALYVTALVFVWFASWVSLAIYLLVAIMWIVPDRRIEKALEK